MIRFLGWFTVEVTSGLIMLFAWLTLMLRPFASGLATLDSVFSLSISMPLFQAQLFIFGWALILLRKVHWVAFVLMLSPLWLYALSLVASTALGLAVGPMGFIFGLVACGLLIYIRMTRQKHEPVKNDGKPMKRTDPSLSDGE